MKLNTCVIIDDDEYAIEGLKNYISSVPTLVLGKCYTDPVEALLDINAGDIIDLILLDINMPKINGLELSREIRQKTRKLVFTTSYTKYGYDAFEAEADAYLLKPYSLSKFVATVSKLFPKQAVAVEETEAGDDFFFVKDKNDKLKIIKIRFQDVVAVESAQNYVYIHSVSKKVLTYMSLTEIAKVFQPFPNFVQFQRSFIINKDHIESIDGNMIRMINGIQFTVGDYYRKDYAAFLDRNLIKTKRKD